MRFQSPLTAAVTARLAFVAVLASLLWLVVGWALGWF
jgi:hypothetical protein